MEDVIATLYLVWTRLTPVKMTATIRENVLIMMGTTMVSSPSHQSHHLILVTIADILCLMFIPGGYKSGYSYANVISAFYAEIVEEGDDHVGWS